jgi:hypothetical protein
MFQPHGYGPLAKMGEELADTFASGMARATGSILPDPVYQGGTVDRSRGSDWLAEAVARGARRRALPERPPSATRCWRRPPGDRIAHHGRARRHAERVRGELVGSLGAAELIRVASERHGKPGTVTGWKLRPDERAQLLERFPPRYARSSPTM